MSVNELKEKLDNFGKSITANWTIKRLDSLDRGLQFLIDDLGKEIKKQGFFSFNIEHKNPSLGPAYPENHESLKLNVTYEQPMPGGMSSFLKSKTFEYLRDVEENKWYKWENHKKEPLE